MIDTGSNEVMGPPISVGGPQGTGPYGIAVTPDGERAYVSHPGLQSVFAIDTNANQVVGSPIPVGMFPGEIAITPDGRTAYVVNGGSNTVSAIDTRTNQVVGSPIPVGSEPYGIAIEPSTPAGLSVSIGKGRVPVRRGQAKAGLSCTGAFGSHCRGTLRLAIKVRRRARPGTTKTLGLGRHRYELPSDAAKRIGVPLTRRALKLLSRFHRLRVRVEATVAGGRPASRKVVLAAPS